jgi:predicted flap endonuclease-1-like 5' DNA nuclease
MALLTEFARMGPFGERAEKSLRTPLGAASPLWFAYGAAASAGIAYWWLTHWTRALNVEAFTGFLAPAMKAPLATPVKAPVAPLTIVPAPALPETPAPAPVALVAPTEAAPVEAAPAPMLAPEPEPEPAAAPAAAAAALADDLTRMSGIGRKLSMALAERGITRFAQIAAWTAADLTEIDKALSLKGRPTREAWVAQAKRLATTG